MNTLILGSEGFIGKHCVAYFQNAGHKILGADLFEQPQGRYSYIKISRLSPEFDELLSQQKFDAVINAAGSGNVPYSMTHPVIDFEANSLDVIRILDAIRKHQPAVKYIHLSSAAVYGNPVSLPVRESDKAEPLSPYGWHKLISEHLCREYTSIFSLRTAILRPFSVYGPGLKKQLFWDLYQKSRSANGKIELFGTGNESRDYLYVTDLLAGIECVLKNGEMHGEVYNLASGKETTIAEAVRIYFDALEVRTPCEFNGKVRQGDPLNWRADVEKIKQLGFTPSIELDKGLQEVAGWIRTV